MDSQQARAFEDPALKVVFRRHYCGECAPAALRRRVCEAIRGRQSDSTRGSTMRITPGTASWPAAVPLGWASVGPSLAIAASFLVVLASVAYLLSTSSQTLPRNLELAAVARHDICCQHADHRKVPRETFPEI